MTPLRHPYLRRLRHAGALVLVAALALRFLPGAYVPGEPGPRPNLLLNPSFDLDQPNEGGNYAGAGFELAMDGWDDVFTSAATGVTLARSSASPPNGFVNAALVTIGTGSATVGASDAIVLLQRLPGSALTNTAFGTAGAQTLSLSFQQKCSVAGTYSVSLRNGGGTRSYVQTYTLAANTWTPEVFVIPGDSAGSWTLSGNSSAAVLEFAYEVGSAIQTATLGAWQTGSYVAGTAQTQMSQTSGANCAVTGVKLEIGPVATPFVRRAPAEELLLAERYYEKSYDQGVAPGTATSIGASIYPLWGTTAGTYFFRDRFRVTKNCDPTLTTYSGITGASGKYDLNGASDITASATDIGENGFVVGVGSFTPTVAGYVDGQWTADCRL